MHLALLLCCLSVYYTNVAALSSDGLTLLSLMGDWSSVPPSIKSTWNASDANPCSWVGVQCDRTLNVVHLNLSGYDITGQLGPKIGLLTHLHSFDLSFNLFSGRIPPQIGNCSQLEHLDLSENGFNGEIPDNLKKLQYLQFFNLYSNLLTGEITESLVQIPSLTHVYLNDNGLSGSIPRNIGNLSEVLYLYLYNNSLSGTIPDSIGNCSKLVGVLLDQNQLVGELPSSLNNLENLRELYLSYNSFEGSINLGMGGCKKLETLLLSSNAFTGGLPAALGNCSSLTMFTAEGANLVGSIPSSFGQLDKLSALYLSENHLSGTIPPELGQCKSLRELLLARNQLQGAVPSELGMLTELGRLELFENRLTGEFPLSIWKIPSLEYVLLYNNSLSGELPDHVAELKQLKNIYLFNNMFFGVIPQSLGMNSSLVQLEFTNNKFTGQIPTNICSGKKLQVLNMGFNQLQGSIPSDIGSCSTVRRMILKKNKFTGVLPEFAENSNLLHMDISENRIAGAIPRSLGNCTNLAFIDLSMNILMGAIPAELGNLLKLGELHLSHNRLEGSLPSQLSHCNQLGIFDGGYNLLNGSVPESFGNWTSLSTLILKENYFTGSIPSFLSKLKMLSEIQIGGNFLGGEVPSFMGALPNLIYALNLSSNGLSGKIPTELGDLMKLERLDLSRNNLTGTLEVLGSMQSLVEANVSFNHFTGPIPENLMNIPNAVPTSFVGNAGLCINCSPSEGSTCSGIHNFNACDHKSSERKVLSKLEIAMIAIGSSLCVVFILLGIVCTLLLCKRPKQENDISAQGELSPLLDQILVTTENLHDKYIIGRGAHGVVYKASLGPGRDFAVKKLEFLGHEGGSQSMVREIKTMEMIRHRNLVKVEDFWFRKDYGLILYRYMQNGSLFDVLHGANPSPALEWNVRYKIAVGTAHALAYLHHDCDPAIVHRGIKPRNILLDFEMEPHISDFGIAKLLDQSSATNSSNALSGTIGYMAPENAFISTMSKESDVYSYGVILLEMITRRNALDPSFSEGMDIVGWVRSVWSETKEIQRIIDPNLLDYFLGSNVKGQATNLLLIALRCTEKEPRRRPTMRDVVKQLLDANTSWGRNSGGH